MGYRKVINRMVKAQRRSADAMEELAEVGKIGRASHLGYDTVTHNICVEAYNVHVKIWNQLQRYIMQLKRRAAK